MGKFLKNFFIYSAAPLLSLTIFILFFQLWKVDLSQPLFIYGGDTFFSAFEIKNVIDSGWFFSNDLIGFPHLTEKFYLHDFPLHADFFNFLLIKIFTYFSSDVFFILNAFFLLSFILISVTSFLVLRHFKISIFTAILVSILYAFLPYHFSRNISHLMLSNYMAIPLVVMAALWIAADKIRFIDLNKKQQFSLAPNRFFFGILAITCFVATSGVYYALYAAMVFVFAWLLRGLRVGRFFDRQSVAVVTFCLTLIFVLSCLYLPSFSYWLHNGFNGAVGNRDPGQSELYALRIVNLILPISNHYLEYFRNLRGLFDRSMVEGERGMESLGILASAGFLFLLLWLFAKSQSSEKSFFQRTVHRFSFNKNEQNLISNLSGLNLLAVLFSTAGGFVMFVALPFPLLRSHARFSIFIAFFSLFLVAIIFDKMMQEKKNIARIFLLLIFVLALFDQVGRVSAESIQSNEAKEKFNSDRNFVEKIEKTMPPGSMIFAAPILFFPEMASYDLMIGYLHSKNLRWSYPAVSGRESYLWQQKTIELDFKDFIAELKKAGFNGVFIDRMLMVQEYGWSELRRFEENLKSLSNKAPITSQNLRQVFFEI